MAILYSKENYLSSKMFLLISHLSSHVLIVVFLRLQFSDFKAVCVSMEGYFGVISQTILGSFSITIQYGVRNPSFTVKGIVIFGESGILSKLFGGLEVLVGFSVGGSYRTLGVLKVVLCLRFPSFNILRRMVFLYCGTTIFMRTSSKGGINKVMSSEVETSGGQLVWIIA